MKVDYYCRHCSHGPIRARRRGGLCDVCFRSAVLREQYPPYRGKFANRGIGIDVGVLPLPPEPVRCLAGSPEKIAALEWRAQSGYALFRPLDGLEP